MEGPLFCMCICDALSLKPRTHGSSLHVMSDTEKEEMWLSLKYKNTKPCRWDVRLRGGPVTWLALVTGCFGVVESIPLRLALLLVGSQGKAAPCPAVGLSHLTQDRCCPICNCVSSPQALGSSLTFLFMYIYFKPPKRRKKMQRKERKEKKMGKYLHVSRNSLLRTSVWAAVFLGLNHPVPRCRYRAVISLGFRERGASLGQEESHSNWLWRFGCWVGRAGSKRDLWPRTWWKCLLLQR